MNIILSIKPCFSDQIYLQNKPLELRKKIGKYFEMDRKIYIYTSSPIKAITGTAEIDSVERLPVAYIKENYLELACIKEHDFNQYYSTHNEGAVIWLKNVIQFKKPICLAELRCYGFTPPQSFSYLKGELRTFLEGDR